MSTIREYAGSSSYYDDSYVTKNKNYANAFLSGLSTPTTNSGDFSLSDYAIFRH